MQIQPIKQAMPLQWQSHKEQAQAYIKAGKAEGAEFRQLVAEIMAIESEVGNG